MTHNQMNTTVSWNGIPAQLPLMRMRAIIEETGLSRSVIYDLIAKDIMPPLMTIGNRASAMPRAWLEAYVQEQAGLSISKDSRQSP